MIMKSFLPSPESTTLSSSLMSDTEFLKERWSCAFRSRSSAARLVAFAVLKYFLGRLAVYLNYADFILNLS